MNKEFCLRKIIQPDGKTVIIPMDHGVSDGPIAGLAHIGPTLQTVRAGGVDAVILHKGIVKQNRDVLENVPYLIHISASTSLGAAPAAIASCRA